MFTDTSLGPLPVQVVALVNHELSRPYGSGRYATMVFAEYDSGTRELSYVNGPPMTNEQKNMELMQTLDDAWNARDWDTFARRHKPDVVVRWPAQPPTHGRHDHRAEGVQMFKTFPDNKVHNRPYKTFFASGDWTCSIARFTGTMEGPMLGLGGKEISPTGKSFEVDFCTVARWDNGEIVEENLFYDVVGLMSQIGVGK